MHMHMHTTYMLALLQDRDLVLDVLKVFAVFHVDHLDGSKLASLDDACLGCVGRLI